MDLIIATVNRGPGRSTLIEQRVQGALRLTILSGVRIGTSDLGRSAEVYGAIAGVPAETLPESMPMRCRIRLREAVLELCDATGSVTGLLGVTLEVPDLLTRQRALVGAGITANSAPDQIRIDPEQANGIEVSLMQAVPNGSSSPAEARLDHVALRVVDLAQASARWETITGVAAEQMGLHPISGGAFSAARLVLDERMIELIAPVAGVDSQIARRLASHGEGVAALALPVDDVDTARRRLEDLGVRVLWQDPHWMVHPGDAAGVLVQLTPRVAH